MDKSMPCCDTCRIPIKTTGASSTSHYELVMPKKLRCHTNTGHGAYAHPVTHKMPNLHADVGRCTGVLVLTGTLGCSLMSPTVA